MPSQRPWFYVAVAVQLLILAAVPAQKLLASVVGKTVLLQVAPVDPYNILSGYYLTLSYEISRLDVNELRQLPDGSEVYVALRPGHDGVWRRIDVFGPGPHTALVDAVVIRGVKRGWRIEFGIESYFVPEARRDAVARDLQQNMDQALVEVRVDSRGNAVLKKLLIADRVYDF
jgi:uncharacterized membrane-anchored protein